MYNIDNERDGYIHFNDYDEAITHLFHKVNAMEKKVKQIKPLIENNENINYYTNNFKSTSFFFRRVLRILHDNNYFTDSTTESYSVCQSIAETEDYFYTFRNGDGINSGGSDAMCINKISKQTHEIVDYNILPNGGKGSGATYNPKADKIYYTAGKYDSYNGGAPTDVIFEVDPYTLNVTRTINTGEPGNTKCIAYDENRDEYIIGNTTHVLFRFDSEFNKIETIDVDTWENAGAETQDIDIFNDLIYCVTSSSNTVTVFDINGKYLWANSTLEADHWIGETQGISHWKDVQHIQSTVMSGYHGDERMTQIFKICAGEGNMPDHNGGRHPFSIKSPMTLYVSKSAGNGSNPTGTEAHPYYEIWEAINDANMCYGKCNICVDNATYRQLSIYNSKYIEIYPMQASPNITIRGLLVGDGSVVRIRNCKIGNPVQNWINNGGNVLEGGARLTLSDCSFTNTSADALQVFSGGELTVQGSISVTSGYIKCGSGGKIFPQDVGLFTKEVNYRKTNVDGNISKWLCMWGDRTWHDLVTNTYTIDNKTNFRFLGLFVQVGGETKIVTMPIANASSTIADGGGNNHFDVYTSNENNALSISNVVGSCKLKAVYLFD